LALRGFFESALNGETMPRLDRLPPYLFTAIDQAKRSAIAAGKDVVDLGIGDPDMPTPAELVAVMAKAITSSANHQYPDNKGSESFRNICAAWFEKRFGVKIDSDKHVLALIGSKEGLAHLPLALLDEGDEVLIPDIGYPVYTSSTLLAGGNPVEFPLSETDGFIPQVEAISKLVTDKTRLLHMNYPNNPTGAVADGELFKQMADLAAEKDFVLSNDAAYIEVNLDDSKPVSLLQYSDIEAQPVIEFHSLSKMFNMTGWRVGFAVGNEQVISALNKVKQNIDSGIFTAVQQTAEYALGDKFDDLIAQVMAPYIQRKKVIMDALTEAGVSVFATNSTFYVWAKVPTDETSMAFCARMLKEKDLVVTPGNGFGTGGEGWFRISLTAADSRIDEAALRLRSL
jgi:LL-diaminopimelate aminotransferase